ncbi:protein arginine N-methyltransferase 7 [Cloeon dipterum]|uniref:protein arginine N-methyltransferase 7 n=1 Tax=Cloeon dipterum TaxID=197152 RepID=UPI00321FD0D2
MAPVRVDSLSDTDYDGEDFDWNQNIARAGFADMLFDTSRNELYKEGLKAAIRLKHEQGEKANVLDIGTGTGLLSMMAVECGADSVVACEAFSPMAECATKIIKLNKMGHKIKVVNKHSTKMEIGVDLEQRANILVTEVFDTDLIGEGAIETFRHANSHLLEPGSFVIPSTATIYIQLVSGQIFQHWMRLQPEPRVQVTVPKDMEECSFSNSHDMQISMLEPNKDFVALSEPVPVLDFDLTSGTLAMKRSEAVAIEAIADGSCPGVFFWWDLKMDPEKKVTLSCAPHWAGNPEWRDHWMQSFFYFPKEIDVVKGQKVQVTCCHDEFNFWFFTENSVKSSNGAPPCTCDLHRQLSLTRLGQINDLSRRDAFLNALNAMKLKFNQTDTVVYLGGASLLPIMAARVLGSKVCAEGDGGWSRRLTSDKEVEWNTKIEKAQLVLAEPYFEEALLPWHNLRFWKKLRSLGSQSVLPLGASIWAMPVQFTHLWKIRAPLGTCMGFKMDHFDELIMKSIVECDEPVEPQPLWEYETICLGKPINILNLDFADKSESLDNSDSGAFLTNGTCHGFALWMEWNLTKNITTSTGGPLEPPKPNEKVQWDKFTRQGVYFCDGEFKVSPDDFYRFNVSHEVDACKTEFSFSIFMSLDPKEQLV